MNKNELLHKTVQALPDFSNKALATLAHFVAREQARRQDPDQPPPTQPGEQERTRIGNWTFVSQLINCGKHSCKTCGGKTYRHGPYWYAYRREAGRLKSHYIGRELKMPETQDDDTDDDEPTSSGAA
jgi:copper oxidase (laccase) domain-containing protein